MTTQSLTLMNALTQKMDWLENNQKTIAQNVANADTQGFRPTELVPLDFKKLLGNSASPGTLSSASAPIVMSASSGLATTDPKHLALNGAAPGSHEAAQKTQKKTYEVAPAGNAVVLEEQLLKMNANFADHRLITNLYQKNFDLLKASVRTN